MMKYELDLVVLNSREYLVIWPHVTIRIPADTLKELKKKLHMLGIRKINPFEKPIDWRGPFLRPHPVSGITEELLIMRPDPSNPSFVLSRFKTWVINRKQLGEIMKNLDRYEHRKHKTNSGYSTVVIEILGNKKVEGIMSENVIIPVSV